MHKKYFEEQICQWLNSDAIRENIGVGNLLINVAFHHLIRWYPQISNDGFDLYKFDFLNKIRNCRITNRAIQSFRSKLWSENGNLLNKNLTQADINQLFKESTHPEHNVSVQFKKDQLMQLSESPNLLDVQNCLRNGYEVVLISKEEKNVLNGSPNKEYELDGVIRNGAGLAILGEAQERMDAINATFNQAATNELIENLISAYPFLRNI